MPIHKNLTQNPGKVLNALAQGKRICISAGFAMMERVGGVWGNVREMVQLPQ
jgi:hypothetical protein